MSDKSYAAASNERQDGACRSYPKKATRCRLPEGNRHINRFKMAHMIGVAEYMRERANDYELNPDAMYVVGLLHDIGYLGGKEAHEQRGARILSAAFGLQHPVVDLVAAPAESIPPANRNMDEGVVAAIENHGKNLYELQAEDKLRDEGERAVTPLLVLLVEADMSVDARGYRVGFEGRLADIGRRYGEDSIAYKTVKDNIQFIKEWQKENGIGKPTALYHKKTTKGKGEER